MVQPVTDPRIVELEQRLVDTEARASRAELDASRFRIGAQYGLTLQEADGLLSGTDEAQILEQAIRLKELFSQNRGRR